MNTYHETEIINPPKIIQNSTELLELEQVRNGLLYRGVSTLEAARMLQRGEITQSFSDWARIDYQIPANESLYYWLPNLEKLSSNPNTQLLHSQILQENPRSSIKNFNTLNFLTTAMSYACGLSINDYFKYLSKNSSAANEANLTREDIIKFIIFSGNSLASIPRNERLDRIIKDVQAEVKDTYPFAVNGLQVTDEIVEGYPELKEFEKLTTTFGDDIFIKMKQSLYSSGCLLVAGNDALQNSSRVIAANFEDGEIITTSTNPLPISSVDAIIPLSDYDKMLLKGYSNKI